MKKRKWLFKETSIFRNVKTSVVRSNLLYSLILDDAKYVTYDGSNMQGSDNYYTNDKLKRPDSVRFAGKEKITTMYWVEYQYPIVAYPSHFVSFHP